MNIVPITSDPESLPTGFDAFYLIYARHEARKDALKAWNALSADDQLAAMDGALAWRKNYLARERQHVPLPATFLRGERWTDELPTTVVSTQQASHVPFGPATIPTRGEPSAAVKAELRRILGKR